MTKKHFEKIKISLQAINNIQLQRDSSQIVTCKNRVKVDYKHTIIDLGDYQIIVSGSAEQYYQLDHSTERIWLMITIYDNNADELSTTIPQHTTIKKLIKEKLTA
jgi:hypothetical protein